MESKVGKQVEQDMIEEVRRLTPEQRLEVFAEHCRLMMELYLAGKQDAARVIAAAGESLNVELTRRIVGKFGPEAAESLKRLLST